MNLERNRVIHQLTVFEEIAQKRLHPMHVARQYLSGTKSPISSGKSNSESTTNNSLLTNEEQEEKLALDGIVIDWMVHGANIMRKHRPPYGLVYSKSGFNEDLSDKNMEVVHDANLLGDPFSTFSFAIRHTLADALKEKLKQISATPEGREAAIYKRHMEFANRNGTKPDDQDGIKYTVSSSNTGLRIMGDILANARDIDSTPLGRKVTIDESANAARNSTPLIVKLSSFEQGVFDTIYRSMAEGGIWRSLTIVEHAGEMSYQIKDPVLQAAITQLSKPDIRENVEKNKRAGCPARMRFEGKESAIRILWDWYIDYSVEASQNA